jgi:hypothetical protein
VHARGEELVSLNPGAERTDTETIDYRSDLSRIIGPEDVSI